MARTQTMVQLTDELVALLDDEAARLGKSRSALIRVAVERYLSDARDREIARRIVDGYRRVPPATPDEWGSVADVGDASTREVLRRLDTEEQGLEPW